MINQIYNFLIKQFQDNSLFSRFKKYKSSSHVNICETKNKERKNSNVSVLHQQKILIQMVVLLALMIIAGCFVFAQEKLQEAEDTKKIDDIGIIKVDLPDKNLDTEKRWRNHFERMRADDRKEFEDKLEDIRSYQDESIKKANENLQRELDLTKKKLDAARYELMDANRDLKKAIQTAEEKKITKKLHLESKLEAHEFESNVEYDTPKSAVNYIPEGTYFTGNLLGGVIVSTALNTPEENATPVVIRLKNGSTNLSKLNKLDLGQCKIIGSAYGDLSSERAIVRLEKMVCYKKGMYVTSKIFGQLYGPDGYNGVKGTVISTGIKHLKGAAIGGFISGISGAADGESNNINISGMTVQKTPNVSKLATAGALRGGKNVGEKIAEYYLKQSESMFPVLTIPPGARVQAQITRGFYVGEISTHKKIKASKR